MDQIAAFLIEKETITGKEFMQIFRRVKGIPEPEEEKTDEDAGQKTDEDAARLSLIHISMGICLSSANYNAGSSNMF